MTSIWTVFLTHSYIYSHVAHLLAPKLHCIWLLNILLQSFCLRILVHTPFQASVWLVLKTRPGPAGEEACNSSAGPQRGGRQPDVPKSFLQETFASWRYFKGSGGGDLGQGPHLVELTVGMEGPPLISRSAKMVLRRHHMQAESKLFAYVIIAKMKGKEYLQSMSRNN